MAAQTRARSWSWETVLTKLIAQTPYGFDDAGVGGIVLDFFPDPLDVDRQCVVVDKLAGSVPDLHQKLFAGEHKPAVGKEI